MTLAIAMRKILMITLQLGSLGGKTDEITLAKMDVCSLVKSLTKKQTLA